MSTTTRTISFSPDAVRKRNKRFAAMSPAQKRVTIARDVLSWLSKGRIQPKAGSYFISGTVRNARDRIYATAAYDENDSQWADYRAKLAAADAQEVVVASDFSCQACALGSVFACAVARANSINLLDFDDAGRSDMHSYLEPYFSSHQLDMIETAFELERYGDMKDWASADAEACLSFGSRAGDATERMVAIMKNIIANGGEFKP